MSHRSIQRPPGAPQRHRFACAVALLAGLAAAGALSAADCYVAPDGDDLAAGSKAAPFATLARAQQAAQPGDTVYIRGGTYRITEAQIARRQGLFASVILLDKSGTRDAPIRYWACPGERPVFDFSAVRPADQRVLAWHVTGSWLHLRGFEIVGVQVTLTGHTQSECIENQGSGNIFQALAMHDGQAIGFYLTAGSDNLILDCDAYRNHDATSEDHRGGNTDGFGCHPRAGATGNVFRGCRAWFNSDDGFDSITACETVRYERCWAFYNGFSTAFASLGDGNGFKVGGWAHTPTAKLPAAMPGHVVLGCLAVRNKANGFYANHHLVGSEWRDNTAYRNAIGFNLLMRTNRADGSFDLEVPGFGQRLVDNLAFKDGKALANLDVAASEVRGNAFSPPLPIAERDFLSLDEAQLVAPRQADGALPQMTFLHLAPGSTLSAGCFTAPAPAR